MSAAMQRATESIEGVFESRQHNQIEIPNHESSTLAILAILFKSDTIRLRGIKLSEPQSKDYSVLFRLHPSEGGKVQVQLLPNDEDQITLQACPYDLLQIGDFQSAVPLQQDCSSMISQSQRSQQNPSVLAFNLNYNARRHRIGNRKACNSFLSGSIDKHQIERSLDQEVKGYLNLTYKYRPSGRITYIEGADADGIVQYDNISAAVYINDTHVMFMFFDDHQFKFRAVDDLSVILGYHEVDVSDIVAISLFALRADLSFGPGFKKVIRDCFPQNGDQRHNSRLIVHELFVLIDKAPSCERVKVFRTWWTSKMNTLRLTPRVRELNKMYEAMNNLTQSDMRVTTVYGFMKCELKRICLKFRIDGMIDVDYRDLHRFKPIHDELYSRKYNGVNAIEATDYLEHLLEDAHHIAKVTNAKNIGFWDNALLRKQFIVVSFSNGNAIHTMVVCVGARCKKFRREFLLRIPRAVGFDVINWPNWRTKGHADFKAVSECAVFASKTLNDYQGRTLLCTLDECEINKQGCSLNQFLHDVNHSVQTHGGERKGVFAPDSELFNDNGFVIMMERLSQASTNTTTTTMTDNTNTTVPPPISNLTLSSNGTGHAVLAGNASGNGSERAVLAGDISGNGVVGDEQPVGY